MRDDRRMAIGLERDQLVVEAEALAERLGRLARRQDGDRRLDPDPRQGVAISFDEPEVLQMLVGHDQGRPARPARPRRSRACANEPRRIRASGPRRRGSRTTAGRGSTGTRMSGAASSAVIAECPVGGPSWLIHRPSAGNTARCSWPTDSPQCRKCRRPVRIMAMSCSSQAVIVSSSRCEPPGWMIAVTPAGGGGVGAVAEGEEGVRGEHRALRPLAGLLDGDPHRVEPAHLAGADAHDLTVPRPGRSRWT